MKLKGNDKTLESSKLFPYIAWMLTIGFTLFVYNIALELQAVVKELQQQTQFLQEQVSQPPAEIENFERPSVEAQ